MVEWHQRCNGHEFEQALGYGEGQGSLVCYSPWGCKELDMTERLNSKFKVRKKKGIFYCFIRKELQDILLLEIKLPRWN